MKPNVGVTPPDRPQRRTRQSAAFSIASMSASERPLADRQSRAVGGPSNPVPVHVAPDCFVAEFTAGPRLARTGGSSQ